MNLSTISLCLALLALFIASVTLTIKVHKFENIIYTMTLDIDKLKKVAVGNYVDISKIKKHFDIDTNDSKTGDTNNKES